MAAMTVGLAMTGGTVYATGEGGAGIGSGDGFDGTNVCGNITITGGTVTATVDTHHCISCLSFLTSLTAFLVSLTFS